MIKSLMFILISLTTSLALAARKIEFNSDNSGAVTFIAVGKPSAIKINGTGGPAKGNLNVTGNTVSGVLTFDLQTLKTGIELRDKHMKEKYLQVSEYPQAQLTLTDLQIPPMIFADKNANAQKVPFKGKLKLKNEEHEVNGEADLKRSGDKINVTTDFSIKLDQFGVEIPKYLGVTVASDVKIHVTALPVIVQ